MTDPRFFSNPFGDCDKVRRGWANEFHAAGGQGKVVDVWADRGRFGSIAIWLKVKHDGETLYYSPYLDQDPSEDDVEALDRDMCVWLDMMLGATEWGESFGDSYDEIPDY